MALRQFARNISTFRVLGESLREPLAQTVETGEHHADSWKKWRSVFYYVCVPAMILAYVNVSLEEEPKPPEFKKYPYLRIRNKKFPWRDGVKTLFHNPHMNPLPDGFEHDGH